MKEEINPVICLSELKKEDFNKLKKWKEEEYSKIRSDLRLILERPNSFQPPGGHLRYPPVYDLFSPRRTPGYPRPGSTLEITRPSSMVIWKQLSTRSI